MAGDATNDPDDAISGINVTPLVDIMLVLLVVFMVTAKIMVSQSIPLDLPKASTGTDVQTVLSVTLTADGRALVDGHAIGTDDDVLPLATAAQEKNPELRAVIRADGDVAHRRVVRMLDLLRRGKVTKVAFGVVPERAP